MKRVCIQAQRLVGLFALSLLLFSFPLLALFDRPVLVLGIPLLHLYLFGMWFVVILALALLLRRLPRD